MCKSPLSYVLKKIWPYSFSYSSTNLQIKTTKVDLLPSSQVAVRQKFVLLGLENILKPELEIE